MRARKSPREVSAKELSFTSLRARRLLPVEIPRRTETILAADFRRKNEETSQGQSRSALMILIGPNSPGSFTLDAIPNMQTR